MIIDLNVIANEKNKQDEIIKLIFKMNNTGMIDSSDFSELILMTSENMTILARENK